MDDDDDDYDNNNKNNKNELRISKLKISNLSILPGKFRKQILKYYPTGRRRPSCLFKVCWKKSTLSSKRGHQT